MKGKETYSVVLDGIHIPYRIRKSQRARNIRLTFEDSGNLVVTLPLRRQLKDIETALIEHKKWILRKFKEARTQRKIPPPFLLKDGSYLPVIDRSFRLSLSVNNKRTARWSFFNNTLNIMAPRLSPSIISRGIVYWYKTMAKLFLEDRVAYWSKIISISPNAIRVKNQHTVWGSCSKKANLNFNWRILLLSKQAADYLIIHELTHLKEMNHSPRFWQLVEEFCPDYRIHKAELKVKNAWLRYPDKDINPQ